MINKIHKQQAEDVQSIRSNCQKKRRIKHEREGEVELQTHKQQE